MAEKRFRDRIARFIPGSRREAETLKDTATYAPISHDGEFYIQRTLGERTGYAGPFASLNELKPILQDLQRGTTPWNELNPQEIFRFGVNWPREIAGHTLDIQREDGEYRIHIEKAPRKIVRDGETQYEPGFRAMANETIPELHDARMAADDLANQLKEGRSLDESQFQVTEIERPAGREGLAHAPVSASEFRSHLSSQSRSADQASAAARRPFRLADAMPARNAPQFFVNNRNMVVFDGPYKQLFTPPLNPQAAQDLARSLNRQFQNRENIDWRAHGFGMAQPSPRRVFVAEVNEQHYVYYASPVQLARSQPMSHAKAQELRDDLVEILASGDKVHWKSFGMDWQNHNPDRLNVFDIGNDQYKISYEFREQKGFAPEIYLTRDDANVALDRLRRQMFRFEGFDRNGWEFHPKAECFELKIRETQGEQFKLVNGVGRVYHQFYDDYASAENALKSLESRIGSENYVPSPPEWLWADQVNETSLARVNDIGIERLLEAIESGSPEPKEVLAEITDRLARDLDSRLEKLSPAETNRLVSSLDQFVQVKEIRQQLNEINSVLRDPELREPNCTPGNRAIRLDYQKDRDRIAAGLQQFPKEGQLARQIAMQLKGKRIEPEVLAGKISQPELRHHAVKLLESYRETQRTALPQALAIGLAAQRSGNNVPVGLLSDSARRWIGTASNLSPVHFTGVLGAVRQAAKTAQRAFATEQER